MRTRILAFALAIAFWPAPAAQEPGLPGDSRDEDVKLPSGKSQREEILKDEHEKSLRDVAQLIKLSTELQAALEKDDYHVLSLASLKKAEDIEKLARRIRNRLKH
ncbi:MAG TPA: hypothetical protein VHA11_01970 [Bryobacteraceae bacterium]|nr:hypothetical protein [Bryobacteraceae bacterium]